MVSRVCGYELVRKESGRRAVWEASYRYVRGRIAAFHQRWYAMYRKHEFLFTSYCRKYQPGLLEKECFSYRAGM